MRSLLNLLMEGFIMICKDCGSNKIKVIDNVSTPSGDVYRKRKCPDCKREFYTIEKETDLDGFTRNKWNAYHRKSDKRRSKNTTNIGNIDFGLKLKPKNDFVQDIKDIIKNSNGCSYETAHEIACERIDRKMWDTL